MTEFRVPPHRTLETAEPLEPPVLGQTPWRVLGPAGMVESRGDSAADLRRLPAGTPICLVADTPLARWRLRRLARQSGIEVQRELIVLPSTKSALVMLDDEPRAVAAFWDRVATVPPGPAKAFLPATLAVRLGRRLPWRLTGGMAPGRVLIGRRNDAH